LNEQFSFVGVLEFNPSKGSEASGQMVDSEDFFTGIPNEDKLPHLHVISVKRNTIFQNQHLQAELGVELGTLKQPEAMQSLHESRLKQEFFKTSQKLKAILKLVFRGDELAADYALLNMISKVHVRSIDGIPLGHLNVNISGLSTEQAKQVQRLLTQVMPLQINFQINTQSLSEVRLQPKKNYDTNQMEPGMLQMLDCTFLCCDETQMNEGKIEKNGVFNIKALAELIEDQKVVYDFQYSQQNMPISAGVLILSDGKSMFKNTLHLECRGQASEGLGEQKLQEILNDQELVSALRRYFLLLKVFSE